MARLKSSILARINRTTGVTTANKTRVNNGKRTQGRQYGFGTRAQKRADLRSAFGGAG